MHIFAHLEENLSSFEDIEAYGAIVFVSREMEDEIFLGRFNDGELSIAIVKDFGVVWSSDGRDLKFALRAAGLKGKVVKLMQGECYTATPGAVEKTGLALDFTDPWSSTFWSKGGTMALTGSGGAPDASSDELLEPEVEDYLRRSLWDYQDYGDGTWCDDCGEFTQGCRCEEVYGHRNGRHWR
jgi:hypothetical protein